MLWTFLRVLERLLERPRDSFGVSDCPLVPDVYAPRSGVPTLWAGTGGGDPYFVREPSQGSWESQNLKMFKREVVGRHTDQLAGFEDGPSPRLCFRDLIRAIA